MTQVPAGLKRAVWGALIFAGLVGYGAANDLYVLLEPPTLNVSQFPALPPFDTQPEIWREAMRALMDTQMSAYQSMAWSRGLLLFGICMATSIVFAEGLRLARIDGGREGARRRLSLAMLIAVVLRTLEGAQTAAIARRAGAAFDKVLAHAADVPADWPQGVMATSYTALAMVMSFIIGGGLLLLTMYFRSERVKQAVAALDAATPPAE